MINNMQNDLQKRLGIKANHNSKIQHLKVYTRSGVKNTRKESIC